MTLQLNPTTSDAYETKTLAQLRQMVFDGMGFLNLFATTRTESLVSIRTDIFNMLGMAAMAAFPPPGVTAMLNSFINEAQQQLYRAIESNFFGTASGIPPPVLVNDTDVTGYDGQIIRTLALGMAKVHYGQEDGQFYIASNQKYLNDLKDRMPPNAVTLVNRVLRDAQIQLYREYRVFRMERWFTWTLQANQRFYPIAGNDERTAIPAPTGVTVNAGAVGTYGSMNVNRAFGGAVLMNDGRILFIGGNNGVGDENSAEIYNPTTGIFTLTKGLMAARREQAATVLLPSGQVLVAGGQNGLALNSVEIYDPPSDTFLLGPLLNDSRYSATATLLKNGKILIAGGFGPLGSLNTAEIYDPSLGTAVYTGSSMVAHRGYHTATLLANGTVLLVGGINNLGSALNSAEIYDPVGNTFTAVGGTMSVSVFRHSAVALTDGTVLIIGGATALLGPTVTATSQIYNPGTGSFSNTTGSLATARSGGVATLLPNGKAIIFAGEGATATALTSSEVYDPVAKTFSAGPALTTSRILGAMSVWSPYTQKFYIAGSYNSDLTTVTNNAEIYDYPSNSVKSSGIHTFSVRSYRVAFANQSGATTNASVEVSASINGDTAVIVGWTPPTGSLVKYALIYGRSAGTEQLIAQTDPSTGSYTDLGTIIPNGAYPTTNTTGNTGPILDQRELSWVGVSQGDVGWRPLSKPIPPQAYTSQTSGVPNWYDIREQIEIWPPSPDSTWQLRIKGYFTLGPFEENDDVTTIDWQAVYLWGLALTKAEYKRQDANAAFSRAQAYIGSLVGGSHGTARYIPGRIERGSVTRPVMTGTFPYS